MIMGQYYYGYKISSIYNYIKDNTGYYKACENNGEYPVVKSWIDLFLLRDVYVLGFGMDLSESDFWWLACHKKAHFLDTKIYSLEPNMHDGNPREIMANTYGIELKCRNKIVKDGEYNQFYEQALKKLCVTLK